MERKLTGWHVLAIFGTAFAVIISVNLTLAYNAVASFPGLESKNPYVTSQQFQTTRAAQQALGWTVAAHLDGDALILEIDDDLGAVVPHITKATLGRATHVNQDQTPDFDHNGTHFVANVGPLSLGNWNLRLEAVAPNGTPFRQRIVVGRAQ